VAVAFSFADVRIGPGFEHDREIAGGQRTACAAPDGVKKDRLPAAGVVVLPDGIGVGAVGQHVFKDIG
jgi:hypothetical protein